MNEKHASKLFWAVKATLVVILLYVAVAVIATPLHLGRALKPHSASGNDRTADTSPTRPPAHTPADISTILERDLFSGSGSGQASSRIVEINPAEALSTEQELGLRMIGAVAGDPSTSRAVIQSIATGAARPYKVGDVVASATIESIDPDRVVLRLEGRRKVLRLHGGPVVASQSSPAATQAQSAPAPQRSSPAAAESLRDLPRMTCVEDVLRKARIEPYVQNGRMQGLRITGMENMPLVGLLGLQNGDVIQTVNGQNLTNKQKAFQVLQKAKTQSQLHIQLLRDGKTRELSFDLQ
jgi:general secretion pathway protein C